MNSNFILKFAKSNTQFPQAMTNSIDLKYLMWNKIVLSIMKQLQSLLSLCSDITSTIVYLQTWHSYRSNNIFATNEEIRQLINTGKKEVMAPVMSNIANTQLHANQTSIYSFDKRHISHLASVGHVCNYLSVKWILHLTGWSRFIIEHRWVLLGLKEENLHQSTRKWVCLDKSRLRLHKETFFT